MHVGAYSFLGANATLRNGIRIGARSLLGAGAVIMADTEEGKVFVPRPARRLAKSSDEIDLESGSVVERAPTSVNEV